MFIYVYIYLCLFIFIFFVYERNGVKSWQTVFLKLHSLASDKSALKKWLKWKWVRIEEVRIDVG